MSGDLLIRGARVVDGSGNAGYTADVEVRGGRIARIGRLGAVNDVETIDADGLALTPGFVDIHTHYDAQLFYEPTASPSSWHGVTTVITGNCGFTFAPASGDDLPWLLQMLAKVEGMPPESLAAGVDFGGGSFADFLGALDGRVAVNVAGFVGHCAVRRAVMGDAASERTATDAEIAAMAVMVRDAMDAGAFGFSSSQLEVHADHQGLPVPSNLADARELVGLASVLAAYDEAARLLNRFDTLVQYTRGNFSISGSYQTVQNDFNRPLSVNSTTPLNFLTGAAGKTAPYYIYGALKDLSFIYTFDADYTPSSVMSFFVEYTHERYHKRMISRNRTPGGTATSPLTCGSGQACDTANNDFYIKGISYLLYNFFFMREGL